MPVNAKDYRDYLYRNGTHPQGAVPKSEVAGFPAVFSSILPFLIAEYFLELKYASLPTGLAFPAAHLLFWAFYYTYVRPGYLEKQLSAAEKWELLGAPTILLGSIIWFVKLIFVEFIDRIVVRWMFGMTKSEPPPRPRPRPTNYSRPTGSTYSTSQQAKPSGPAPLPRELAAAMGVLGLEPTCREWSRVHARYRELAKQFHPDLNSEITTVGNRFMLFDAAYRKLEASKNQYFKA